MEKTGICNSKGDVGKTTISLCLAGAFAEMELKVLLVDMDQKGSLRSSFLMDTHNLPIVITDTLRDVQVPYDGPSTFPKYDNLNQGQPVLRL